VARDLIDARVVEPVRLLDLARACDEPPLRVLRAFRAAYGLPPHRYQLQRRVQLAQGRLRAGADLAALAAELGFADQSHFTRVFKSVVGVPPAPTSVRPPAAEISFKPRRAVGGSLGPGRGGRAEHREERW
jgi:AraC-like DNA-binding protein